MIKDSYNINNDTLKFEIIKKDGKKLSIITNEDNYLENLKRLLKNEFYRTNTTKRSS